MASRKTGFAVVLPVLLSVSAPAAHATPSEDASTRIEADMTIEGVEKAIGFRPNIVEQKTCGGTENILPWSCRVQTYADGKRTLLVYFSRADSRSGWRVHSWYVQ